MFGGKFNQMNCPNCQGRSVKYGTKMTKNGRVQRFQCQECGHVFTGQGCRLKTKNQRDK